MKYLRLSAQLEHFTGNSFLWQNHYNLLNDVTENKVNTLCSIASVNTMLKKTHFFFLKHWIITMNHNILFSIV